MNPALPSFFTIASGATLSSVQAIRNMSEIGLLVAGGSMSYFLRAGHSSLAMTTHRLRDPVTPSSDFVISAFPNSLYAVNVQRVLAPFAFVQVEAAAALIGPSSFALVGKFA